MAITYDQLTKQLLLYTNKTKESDPNFYASLPFFVNMALERLYGECLDSALVQKTTLNGRKGNPELVKPLSWLKTISLGYSSLPDDNFQFLTLKTPEVIKYSLRSDADGAYILDAPKFYSDASGEDYTKFLLAPVPDKDYPFTLCFVSKPPQVVINQDGSVNASSVFNNWAFQIYPSLIFSASLCEAYLYMREIEAKAAAEEDYRTILERINKRSVRKLADDSSNRESA
jgi:hypothetical protein